MRCHFAVYLKRIPWNMLKRMFPGDFRILKTMGPQILRLGQRDNPQFSIPAPAVMRSSAWWGHHKGARNYWYWRLYVAG